MKKYLFFLATLSLFIGCTDDESELTYQNSSQFASKPEAKAIFNNSFKGIYKGTILNGSTGFIYINILNDGQIAAKLKTNSSTISFIVLEQTISLDELGELHKYKFGNSDSTFFFEVYSDGSKPVINNVILYGKKSNGYSIQKELSNAQVKCYSGHFEGTDNGMLVFSTREDGILKGFHQQATSNNPIAISGTLTKVLMGNDDSEELNNSIPGDSKINPTDLSYLYKINSTMFVGQLTGYLSGYTFSGNWIYEESILGKWQVDRIM